MITSYSLMTELLFSWHDGTASLPYCVKYPTYWQSPLVESPQKGTGSIWSYSPVAIAQWHFSHLRPCNQTVRLLLRHTLPHQRYQVRLHRKKQSAFFAGG